MGDVRNALEQLAGMRIDLWSEDVPDQASLVVDQRGAIFLRTGRGFTDLRGNSALPHDEQFGLLDPFEYEGHQGPDLLRPRPHLRIVPDRVAGEPHLEHTRLTTQTLAGLAARGYSSNRLAEMYDVPEVAVREAVDLESTLRAA
jgi:uncharacterized protein (DUF433 family)